MFYESLALGRVGSVEVLRPPQDQWLDMGFVVDPQLEEVWRENPASENLAPEG